MSAFDGSLDPQHKFGNVNEYSSSEKSIKLIKIMNCAAVDCVFLPVQVGARRVPRCTPQVRIHCHHQTAIAADYPNDSLQWWPGGRGADSDESFEGAFDASESSFDSIADWQHAPFDSDAAKFVSSTWHFSFESFVDSWSEVGVRTLKAPGGSDSLDGDASEIELQSH